MYVQNVIDGNTNDKASPSGDSTAGDWLDIEWSLHRPGTNYRKGNETAIPTTVAPSPAAFPDVEQIKKPLLYLPRCDNKLLKLKNSFEVTEPFK